MTIKAKLLVLTASLALFIGTYYAGYLKGWYAHSDQVNNQAKEKDKKREKAVADSEQKTATANAEAKVIYRTIYRDVVKYVNDTNRTVCQFDAAAVQLRQQAIDAANAISGFDAGTVQGREQSGH